MPESKVDVTIKTSMSSQHISLQAQVGTCFVILTCFETTR
jgi:hypothetical protein